MFDFRYHALSLVAVFVALAIGLLLGIAVGDQNLVSNAEQKLRAGLRGNLQDARGDAAELRKELLQRRRYESQTFRPLVDGTLTRRRILVLFLDERSDAVFRNVRDAIAPSGGELIFAATLKRPLDVKALGDLARGTRYEGIPTDPGLMDDLGTRIGLQLAQGGRLVAELRGELFSSTSGELDPVEGVVIVRSAASDKGDQAERDRSAAFVEGLLAGLRSFKTPVVGVEERGTEPSQIRWYQDHNIASVDNIDDVAGRASLVVALAGSADGSYGEKSTADALIPEALRTP